jgi:hypothetical protein
MGGEGGRVGGAGPLFLVTADDLAEIEARAQEARRQADQTRLDSEITQHDVPALVAEVRRLRALTARQDETSTDQADALGGLECRVLALRAERDAATALAARLAHVLHAVDLHAGSRTVRGDQYEWARRDLRRILAEARDTQQLVDPHGLAAVLKSENAQMREALRRARDREKCTDAEMGAAGSARLDVCYGCDAVEIAVACLAELDPLAPDPAGRQPAPTPLTVVDVGLPEPPASQFPELARRPDCTTCGGIGSVPDGPESADDCPDCTPEPDPATLTGEAPF